MANPSPSSTSLLLRGAGKNGEAVSGEPSEGNSPASHNSPTQAKLAFGLKKAPAASQVPSSLTVGQSKSSNLEKIFTSEEDDLEKKPKKKLVPIDYSDEEGDEDEDSGRDSRKKRSRRSSGKSSSSRRSSNHHSSEVGMVSRGSGDGLMMSLEEMKDRKLTSEERKKMTQTLVNNIPTVKEEVFQYALKWDQIDKVRWDTF